MGKTAKEKLLQDLRETGESEGEELFYPVIWGKKYTVLDYISEETPVIFFDYDRLLNSEESFDREYSGMYRKARQEFPVFSPKEILIPFARLAFQHEKRIILNQIEDDGRFNNYVDPIFWLEDSMICNICYKCNDPSVGLALNKNDSYAKCYMADTGLLVSLAFSENELSDNELYKQIMNDKLSLNKGMLYENAISQMITSIGKKLYFYTRYSKEKHRNDIEIDFIITNESKTNYKINSIEVKSSKNYSTSSLNEFKKIYRKKVDRQIIIHPKNYKVEGEVIKIPPYMLYLLF